MGIVEVYFCQMVDLVDVPISFLEYTPTNEESIGAFNKEGDKGDNEGDRVIHINEYTEFEAATTQPVASQNHQDLFNEGDDKYESDFHENNINLRAERRSYQRRERRQRTPNDPEEVLVTEVGPNLGFDETEPVDKNLEGKVVGDESEYCRSDAYNNKADLDDETRRDRRRNYVVVVPSNEAGTSRIPPTARGRLKKTSTRVEAPATVGSPSRPRGGKEKQILILMHLLELGEGHEK
ncbi:hypothetical protein KY285_010368 [Solanum tuberosum]|nr:hypothetical protein KY289_012744 [Solanum tuberosum]KAH0734661.1 hypothetical protein KY285_010368 [Solanum tuberosum]